MDFIFTSPKDLKDKLDKIHGNSEKKTEDSTVDDYLMMAKYLLFFATYHPSPVSSLIDTKIMETFAFDFESFCFWNWTPQQKSVFDAEICRMILTSHWSTGKTRILFEKAKILAAKGKKVIFVLHQSQVDDAQPDNFQDNAPILLYLSLLNEIDPEMNPKTQKSKKLKNTMELIKANLELVVTNDLKKVLAKISDANVNIFIDEFTVFKDEDVIKIDEISNKLADESYFWVTVARANARSDKTFKTWLEGKESDDKWCVPTLTNALRNSKEIIEFDKMEFETIKESKSTSESESGSESSDNENNKDEASDSKSDESDSENEDGEPKTPTKSRSRRLSRKKSVSPNLNPKKWKHDCNELLNEMVALPMSAPFREPVSEIEYPDYHRFVATPMDLSTVRESLHIGDYNSPEDFKKDIRLIFKNSEEFNTNPKSKVLGMTQKLEDWFNQRITTLVHDWKMTLRRLTNAKIKHKAKKQDQSPDLQRSKGKGKGKGKGQSNRINKKRTDSTDEEDDQDDADYSTSTRTAQAGPSTLVTRSSPKKKVPSTAAPPLRNAMTEANAGRRTSSRQTRAPLRYFWGFWRGLFDDFGDSKINL